MLEFSLMESCITLKYFLKVRKLPEPLKNVAQVLQTEIKCVWLTWMRVWLAYSISYPLALGVRRIVLHESRLPSNKGSYTRVLYWSEAYLRSFNTRRGRIMAQVSPNPFLTGHNPSVGERRSPIVCGFIFCCKKAQHTQKNTNGWVSTCLIHPLPHNLSCSESQR